MSNKLKRCPWCGSVPDIKQGKSFEDDETIFFVRCSNEQVCDVIPETISCETIEEAINLWNTRAGE